MSEAGGSEKPMTFKEKLEMMKRRESLTKETETPPKAEPRRLSKIFPKDNPPPAAQPSVPVNKPATTPVVQAKDKEATIEISATMKGVEPIPEKVNIETKPIEKTSETTKEDKKDETEVKPTTEQPVKRQSIAEKIAALKASSANDKKPEETLKPTFGSNENPADATPKKSIAERMAALKAASPAPVPSPAAQKETPEGSKKVGGISNRIALLQQQNVVPIKPVESTTQQPKPAKKLSIMQASFAANIPIMGLNPNAPRPPFMKPPGAVEEEGDGGLAGATSKRRKSDSGIYTGEFSHATLSRPAVPSIRRKHATRSKNNSTENAGELPEWNLTLDDVEAALTDIGKTPVSIEEKEEDEGK